jgi:hypothetical protein
MPDAPVGQPSVPVPSSQPVTSAPLSSAPASSSRSYSEDEYKAVLAERDEFQRTVRNAEMFIESDPDVKERLGLYGKSFSEKKPYQDLVKEWEASKQAKNAPVAPAKPQDAGMTQAQIQEMVRRELQTSTQPFIEAQAKQATKEAKENIQKANPWVTDKDWETYDKKFTDYCQQKSQEIKQQDKRYPPISDKDAFNMAVNAFVDTPDEMLFNYFMKEEIGESILGKRRSAPRLPEGMVDGISTGKDPDVLDKARRAYKAIEGNPEAVAKLVGEYAPQLGVDNSDRQGIAKLYSLISKG